MIYSDSVSQPLISNVRDSVFCTTELYPLMCEEVIFVNNAQLRFSLKTFDTSTLVTKKTKQNSSRDEIANVNFLNDDIERALQNTINSCINAITIDAVMCLNAGLPNSVK